MADGGSASLSVGDVDATVTGTGGTEAVGDRKELGDPREAGDPGGCGVGGGYLPATDDDAGVDGGSDALVACDGPIAFADATFEQIVRVAIAKPTGVLTGADVAGLAELTSEFSGVSGTVRSIEGVQCLRSLEYLDIGYSEISDVSPLEALPNFRVLALGHDESVDLAGIAKLPHLTGLFVVRSNIKDVSALAKLDSIVEIALENNRVQDIRPLQNLEHLGMLWLIDNPIDCELNAEALEAMQDRGVKVNGLDCGGGKAY